MLEINEIESGKGIQTEIDILRTQERARILDAAKIELRWWAHHLIEDADQAIEQGKLIKIPPVGFVDGSNNYGYKVIGKLQSGKEPRLIRPEAEALLYIISKKWRDRIKLQRDLPQNQVFISVTSLFRSAEFQRELIEEGANAAEVSSHQAGMTIDIDPNGFYAGPELKSVNVEMGSIEPIYKIVLADVLSDLSPDKCNLILEKGYRVIDGKIQEYDSCFHICVKPEA